VLGIYKLFCLINYPLWWLVLLIRSFRGKEHKKRYIEKLGLGYKKRPDGEVIWVHALGLGETLALLYFLRKMSEKFHDKTILFTSSTLNSYLAFSKQRVSPGIIHQFAPIDNFTSMKRFLSHWKPSLALISEIDLWPIRVAEVKRYGTPLILFNSRMNEKKKKNRKLIYKVFKETLSSFDYIFLQDENSKEHFKFFGVSESTLRICGPFKTAGTDLYENRSLEKKIISVFTNKFVWIAASLHRDEETEILESFKLAKEKLPNLVLIMAPRFPELSGNTEKKCLVYTKNVIVRKSLNEYPKKTTEILVVSTIGELGLWYQVADIAFIGNSLDYKTIKTGKNPFEAIQSNCLVMHGPKMLEPGYSILKEKGISDEVSNRFEISKALVRYASPNERDEKIIKGKKLILKNRRLIEDFIENLITIKKKKGSRKSCSLF
tara:strand:+ start:451 stop:1752 length:1302 start_codon:yes stop_codon:yes gene_type:complete